MATAVAAKMKYRWIEMGFRFANYIRLHVRVHVHNVSNSLSSAMRNMAFISTIPPCVSRIVYTHFIESSEFIYYRTLPQRRHTRTHDTRTDTPHKHSTQFHSDVRIRRARRVLNRYHSYWPNNFNVIGFSFPSHSLARLLDFGGHVVHVCAQHIHVHITFFFFFYIPICIYLVAVICLDDVCARQRNIFRFYVCLSIPPKLDIYLLGVDGRGWKKQTQHEFLCMWYLTMCEKSSLFYPEIYF